MVPEGLPEPVELALQFTALLDRLDIPYLIVGSLASSVHGEARTTADIDLVLDLQAHQVSGLVAGLGSDYYVSEPALQEAVRRGGTANLIHLPSALKLDLFVAGSDAFDRERLRTRLRLELSPGRAAWIDRPEHTLVRKLDWYRRGNEVSDRQWRDILGILRAQGTRLDQNLLDTWATRLGVGDLLARARTEAKLDA